jgi:nitroimidazol reductase NimA-like FMN-containing flavoprotein (pyridoxamine 5'-phosphate oxidase superfamily)
VFVQELAVEECRKALVRASFGRLACARENQPYVVPISFAVDSDDDIYSFSMLGQKIEWMRNNPQVLEIDSVNSLNDWISIVVLGRYEELPDIPDYRRRRQRAYEILQNRAMWWQPGSVAVASHHDSRDLAPVFYRIKIEHLTGRRGSPRANGDIKPATVKSYPNRGTRPSRRPTIAMFPRSKDIS